MRLLWLWSPPLPPRAAAGATAAGGRTHEVGALAAALGSPLVRLNQDGREAPRSLLKDNLNS
jgi:hypothetical protein